MSDDEEYCVYVAGKPFGSGSYSFEECEKICAALNAEIDELKRLQDELDSR